jgi:hypothetical protein
MFPTEYSRYEADVYQNKVQGMVPPNIRAMKQTCIEIKFREWPPPEYSRYEADVYQNEVQGMVVICLLIKTRLFLRAGA